MVAKGTIPSRGHIPASELDMAKTSKTTNKTADKATVDTTAAAPSPLPTPETAKTTEATQPKPATVALRGGAAVAQVKLSGKQYRTAAPHNQQWWKALTEAGAGDKPIAVADVVVSQAKPNGVPAHFIGYCLRRGYLAESK